MKLNLLFLFILLFFGCSNSKVNSIEQNKAFNYNIIFGSGGGVAGTYEGTFIDSTGNAYKWQGRIFNNSKKEFVRTLTANELKEIYSLISSANFFELQQKNSGNITSYIKINSAEKENTVSWSGIEIPNELNENLKELHQEIISIKK